ncbi:MAG: thiamine-phosphate kinase [Elusimicrobiaceae bacterium]|nr:thiamine-phosphate kinase [Elusimicrobiaceae bacterium]
MMIDFTGGKRKAEADILSGIYRAAAKGRKREVLLGPGDDCAVIRALKEPLVITVDEMCEGTHFINPLAHPARIAAKLVAMNVSDLAAMGAVSPVFALCTLAMPRGTPGAWTGRFTGALIRECARYEMQLAGGNLARAEKFHFSLIAAGALNAPAVRRTGARPGDLICAVGRAGDAHAGLDILLGKTPVRGFASLYDYFWRPQPQLEAGRLIGLHGLATAMMDNSDGLYSSVRTLARDSGCGAAIKLPESAGSPVLKRYCRLYNKEWRQYALYGGEDYGLVFTVPPARLKQLRRLLPGAYPIGVMTRGKRILCDIVEEEGFEHF